MTRVAILFDNFGPYHLARLKAASAVCDLLAVEFGSSSAEYNWDPSVANGLRKKVINAEGLNRELPLREFKRRLDETLDAFSPEVLLVPGWGYRGALVALLWGVRRRIPVICMSESTRWDEARNPIKEWIKRRIVKLFSASLVGGSTHREYLEQLGMSRGRIFLGYDAVDNRFFAEGVSAIGARSPESKDQKKPYFLASARFIEKKNLHRLLIAYALYRKKALRSTVDGQQSTPLRQWDLVLLGDGQLRPELEKLRSKLGLEACVQMPGFKQYKELPSYYAHAGAFIHASTTEQWGLVVNEAMASGLPVLVSKRCGCAVDLVLEGENGWTFDPENTEVIANLMVKVSENDDLRGKLADGSRRIILEWGPERFVQGLHDSVKAARERPVARGCRFSCFFLSMLAHLLPLLLVTLISDF